MCSCKGNRNSLCDCHCGTRVDINPQLLEERQAWRLKCEQLELQYKEDLKNLKDRIYKECSTLMEQELRAKQQAFKETEKKRMMEYQSLHERLLPMEPKLDEMVRENQFLKAQIKTLQDDVKDAEDRLQRQRRHHGSDMKQLINRHEAELQELDREKQEEFDRERKQLEAQVYHLKHQIADFESKYRQILPELQKLKHTLHNKTSEVEDLRSRLEDEGSRIRHDPLAETTNRRTARRPSDQTLQFEYRALQRELEEKNRQIEKLKTLKDVIKTQIKYQTVYVDRPVQVERVVEKIVEVEKVVKEYVEPKQPVVVNEIICDEDKQDYDELVLEINNRTRYISQLQNQLAFRIRENEQYQAAAEQYQRNIQKYKAERQNLALTIANKNRQIESLEAKISSFVVQQSVGNQGGEKITVNVKKDGTYSSTVEKMQKGTGANRKK